MSKEKTWVVFYYAAGSAETADEYTAHHSPHGTPQGPYASEEEARRVADTYTAKHSK